MKPTEHLQIKLKLAEAWRNKKAICELRTAIIAITSYEQMVNQYPTMAEEYKKKIEEILNYFNN